MFYPKKYILSEGKFEGSVNKEIHLYIFYYDNYCESSVDSLKIFLVCHILSIMM